MAGWWVGFPMEKWWLSHEKWWFSIVVFMEMRYCIYLYIYIYWLVVDLPLWKMMEWKSVGMMIIPIYIYYGKNKLMFQSTNQMGISRSDRGTIASQIGLIYGIYGSCNESVPVAWPLIKHEVLHWGFNVKSWNSGDLLGSSPDESSRKKWQSHLRTICWDDK